ncbi:MAG: hypothetical protein Q4C33_04755 [bacterium]|nr:hypothetical protein [bacterium]
MIFDFNNDIDIIYALDYFIKKDSNTLKVYNPKNINIDLTELYNLYIKYVDEKEKEELNLIGDFSNKARYVVNNKLNLKGYDKFNNYFNNFAEREKIKGDILSNPGLKSFDLDYLQKFYKEKLYNKIFIYMTPFVSGAFGLKKDDCFYIVLGIKFNYEKNKYTSCGTLVPKIIHELSHPLAEEHLKNISCVLENNLLNVNCYDENQTEELLVRVLEIFLSSKFLGKDYYQWALAEQDSFGFTNVRKIFDLLGDEINDINSVDDFFELLLKNDILETNNS